MAERDILGT
jgi:chromosome segregation ATPase